MTKLVAYMSKEKFFALPSAEQKKKAKESEVYQNYLKEGKGGSKAPAKPVHDGSKKLAKSTSNADILRREIKQREQELKDIKTGKNNHGLGLGSIPMLERALNQRKKVLVQENDKQLDETNKLLKKDIDSVEKMMSTADDEDSATEAMLKMEKIDKNLNKCLSNMIGEDFGLSSDTLDKSEIKKGLAKLKQNVSPAKYKQIEDNLGYWFTVKQTSY